MNGNSRELFRLARSVVMKRLPADIASPEWFNAKDPVEIEGRTTVHYRIVSEIDELSKLTRHLPLTMNLPEDEMRFLSVFFSSLTVMKTPKAMRDAVVKNSDFKAISTRHVAREAEASEYALHEHDVAPVVCGGERVHQVRLIQTGGERKSRRAKKTHAENQSRAAPRSGTHP